MYLKKTQIIHKSIDQLIKKTQDEFFQNKILRLWHIKWHESVHEPGQIKKNCNTFYLII